MSKFSAIAERRGKQPSNIPATQNADFSTTQMRRVGRPRAKRSDPAYQQVTAYIRKDTYTAARKLLLDDGREFSELVEELLGGWVIDPEGKGHHSTRSDERFSELQIARDRLAQECGALQSKIKRRDQRIAELEAKTTGKRQRADQ